MAEEKEIVVSVGEDGILSYIYDDRLSFLGGMGKMNIRRASHVEPMAIEDTTIWVADMSPVGGPVLGPFKLRAEALAAEVGWINRNVL